MADETKQPDSPEAKTAPIEKPAAKPEPPKGGQEKRPFKRGGDGERGPRKRERGPIPSLEGDMLYKPKNAPNVRDLEAEIADELEAALQGMDDKNLYSADDSKRARDQAAAPQDGGRKKGK